MTRVSDGSSKHSVDLAVSKARQKLEDLHLKVVVLRMLISLLTTLSPILKSYH